jgi:hypothetical protein
MKIPIKVTKRWTLVSSIIGISQLKRKFGTSQAAHSVSVVEHQYAISITV